MGTDFFIINRSFKDLNPVILGREECKPGKSYGPAIRNYTLIHYVERGRGRLVKNGEVYPVKEGEAFIILPGEVTYYAADRDDPWVYRWIGFDGALGEKYRELPPVITVSDDIFPNLPRGEEYSKVAEYLLAGQLFTMTAELFAAGKHRNHYVRQVKNYIKSSYMLQIKIEQIADDLSIDRRYLSRIFKERTGQTIQEYLISVRMEEARRHLSEGRGVAETAALCGYADVCNFSKMFKRVCGVSPARWREGADSK